MRVTWLPLCNKRGGNLILKNMTGYMYVQGNSKLADTYKRWFPCYALFFFLTSNEYNNKVLSLITVNFNLHLSFGMDVKLLLACLFNINLIIRSWSFFLSCEHCCRFAGAMQTSLCKPCKFYHKINQLYKLTTKSFFPQNYFFL